TTNWPSPNFVPFPSSLPHIVAPAAHSSLTSLLLISCSSSLPPQESRCPLRPVRRSCASGTQQVAIRHRFSTTRAAPTCCTSNRAPLQSRWPPVSIGTLHGLALLPPHVAHLRIA
ncbi:hypothetical protein DFH06DRAFT_1475117, partial [Mycena polygramma]